MFFFFNDTATTEIYTLSLHDALPIYGTMFMDIKITFWTINYLVLGFFKKLIIYFASHLNLNFLNKMLNLDDDSFNLVTDKKARLK